MALKPPLVALLISPDRYMRDAIHRGIKKITIREGHRDYQAGQTVMLCCHLESWAVMAKVTEVRHCTLGEVAKEEYLADGFQSASDMLNGMRRFYPNLSYQSPVTVIRWDNAQGEWVNDPALYNEKFPFDGATE